MLREPDLDGDIALLLSEDTVLDLDLVVGILMVLKTPSLSLKSNKLSVVCIYCGKGAILIDSVPVWCSSVAAAHQ